MGNHASACFFVGSKKTTIKLFDAQGNLQLLKPMTIPIAVEIMLENIGYAVASLDSLIQTRRISAMRADEPLSIGKTYLLVPLGKVNSRIDDAQKAALERILTKRKSLMKIKRGSHSGGSRVSPTSSIDRAPEDGEKLVEGEKLSLPVCRRWSPSLNPILEE